MTPGLDSATHCERDDDPANCEIEITPEMIEAGVAALDDGLSLDSDHWSLARAVYSAMRGVARDGGLVRKQNHQEFGYQ